MQRSGLKLELKLFQKKHFNDFSKRRLRALGLSLQGILLFNTLVKINELEMIVGKKTWTILEGNWQDLIQTTQILIQT